MVADYIIPDISLVSIRAELPVADSADWGIASAIRNQSSHRLRLLAAEV